MHRKRLSPIVLVGAMVITTLAWCGDLAFGQANRLSGSKTAKVTTATPAAPAAPATPAAPAASADDSKGLLSPSTAQAAPAPAAAAAPAAQKPEDNGAIVPAAPADSSGGIPVNAQVDAQSGIITHLPLQDAPIREVLRQLSNVSQKNIVPGRNVQGKVTADLFNVTWREALEAILRVSDLGAVEEGNFIYVYPLKEIDTIQQSRKHLATKVFTLFYAKPDDVEKLVRPILSKDGTLSVTPSTVGGVATDETKAGGQDYALNDVLVVTDYDDNLKKIEGIVQSVDQRPEQVLIEATILVVRLDDSTQLGVDFTKIPGVDFCKVGFSNNFGNAAGTGTLFTGGSDPVGIAQATTSTVAPGFNGGIEFSSDTSLFIHALETVADTSVVANPKLLVLNKQLGQVHIGQKLGYQDTTTTTQTGGTTASISFLDVGTTLNVRPFVGRDDYIRLEVFPKDSGGHIDTSSGITIPQETTTQCTTNVMVRDGHTIVISGLFRDSSAVSRSQVPVLGNLPLIGWLFRNKTDTVSREEVIILLTPRVVKLPNDSIVSEQLKDDVMRFQIGMRKELSWYSRDRLAACALESAKAAAAGGHNCIATWDVDLALSMSPSMHEALTLREQLTGQAIWANEPRVQLGRVGHPEDVDERAGVGCEHGPAAR